MRPFWSQHRVRFHFPGCVSLFFFVDTYAHVDVCLSVGQSPEAQEKCYSEIAALASRTDGDDFLTYESVEAMRYLAACIKEAIRLTSPSKFVSRETAVDYDIGGKPS